MLALLLATPTFMVAPAPPSSLRAPVRAATSMGSLDRRAVGVGAAAAVALGTADSASAAEGGYPKMTIKTTQGEMEFEMWDDVAPKHVKSFLTLAKQGFFDGGAFHRIIPGFVIQGGDPNAKVMKPRYYGRERPALLYLALRHCPISFDSVRLF